MNPHFLPNHGTEFVVAIDGPAGAGKSTVAKQLADRLHFDFLDTGAMYRCVTLAVLRGGVNLRDEATVLAMAKELEIELVGSRVIMNGEDVSADIRSPEIGAAIGTVADNVAVRKLLSRLQRKWACGRCVVTEGRDQGTEVFHDSPCKVFLVASSEERARRREQELRDRGIDIDFDSVLAQQNKRDAEDCSRPIGALRKAEDAIEFCTDGKSLDSVVDALEIIVRERMAELASEDDRSRNSNSRVAASERTSSTNGK